MRMTRHIERVLLLVVVLGGLSALAVPIWYWDGGLIEIEATQFVRQYLDQRSVLQKIFDPHANDLGTYQARELSYAFDYVDARVFGAAIAAGRSLFVPASAILASLLTLALGMLAVRRVPPPARLPVALLLLVYVTNYVHLVTMGMLYRATKPLLAPVLLGTTLYLVSAMGRPAAARGRWCAPAVIFALGVVMSLLDRQGFFYAALGAGALATHAVLTGGRRDLALGAGAAVLFGVLYNQVLGPALVVSINGYRPDFAYQQLDWPQVFTDPAIPGHAAVLLAQAGAALLGGLPVAGFVALLVVVSAALIAINWKQWKRETAILVGLLALGQWALVSLMIVRHPPIYDSVDHRLWYYPLPFQAITTALLMAAAARRVPAMSGMRRAAVSALLAAIVLGNVVRWDDYLGMQLRSRWFPVVYTQSAALKQALADGRRRAALSPEYDALYQVLRPR